MASALEFRIAGLPADERHIAQAARLLVGEFAEHWPDAWPNVSAALREVKEALSEGRVNRAALDSKGDVIGWVGAIPEYDGRVWEVHPLVVRRDWQVKGVGRALVEDIEAEVKARGGLTLTVGTDDEAGMTSLAGVDLYPDVLKHLANIRNIKRHPYEFYLKMGFVIVGVVPDANGFGKPDILMAKRVV